MNASRVENIERLRAFQADQAHIAALEHTNALLIFALVDISAGGLRYGSAWTVDKMAEVAREALAGAAGAP